MYQRNALNTGSSHYCIKEMHLIQVVHSTVPRKCTKYRESPLMYQGNALNTGVRNTVPRKCTNFRESTLLYQRNALNTGGLHYYTR